MALLSFYYGAMNSGKTIDLLKDAHNLEEKGYKVVIIKSSIDLKGNDTIVSRIGLSRKVDILLSPTDSLANHVSIYKDAASILVDEAQFLTEAQVDELWRISKLADIPVNCYGLRTDFSTRLFEGSKRLFELSDTFIELKTRCRCKEPATFNARLVNGEYVSEGESVVIDGINDEVAYEPLCGNDYIERVLKLKPKKKQKEN